MVILNKIYTRQGDDGMTGLADGSRCFKSDYLVMAYGAVDETNATLGVARLYCTAPEFSVLDAILGRVQNDLFDLGADLATPYTDDRKDRKKLRIVQNQIARLENEIDQLNSALSPLNSFVVPGGSSAGAYLHLSRCVCRRAEQYLIVAFVGGVRVSTPARHYLNRLSDLLFVAARSANHADGDVLWQPGAHQK